MRFDITRLPVGEAIIGFLLAILAVTFVAAFIASEDGGGQWAAAGSPTPQSSPAASPTPGGSPGGALAVTAGDNFFDPDTFTVPAGETVTFEIKNGGAAIHNLRIAGPDGEYKTGDDAVSDPNLLPGGASGSLTWSAPDQPGKIDFRCDFHPQVMTGTITVE